jgi:hypothetical protein
MSTILHPIHLTPEETAFVSNMERINHAVIERSYVVMGPDGRKHWVLVFIYGDINDPNRIWDIPEDWEKIPRNTQYWDHKEVMTPRGRMIVLTQVQISGHNNRHHPYQFATRLETPTMFEFENSEKALTAHDVFPWGVVITDDGFTEEGIERAMEIING